MKRLCLFILVALVAGSCLPAKAQDYPTRQVTIIVPFAPGGSADIGARMFAQKLTERLGKPVVVENRAGAGTVVGASAAARAAPDGYTLLMGGSSALAYNPTLHKNLPYDPAKDFVPLAHVAAIPFVLVVQPSLPVRSVADLIKLAKEKPGHLAFGTAGTGSPAHLCAEYLRGVTGIDITYIPYKGSAPALTDVVAGHVPVLFSDPVPSLPLIREGKVRALGVTTAARSPSAPEIAPIAETGVPGFDVAGWGMITAPAGTPKEIVTRLNAALNSVAALPEVQQQIIKLGMIPGGSSSPEQLQRFINSEMERWGKVVQQAGLAGTE
jgi:tripartite-type tricarboxylate transporter receptor subunit TctC